MVKEKFVYLLIILGFMSIKSIGQVLGTFTDPRDGKIYGTVTIGIQTWMAENLAYKTKHGCWAYNNDDSNISKYGYLYDWKTAKEACPDGWHLPANKEWITLITCSGGDSIAGGKLKETDTVHWRSPNTKATNELRFTALPGGYFFKGNFDQGGEFAIWCSATEVYGGAAVKCFSISYKSGIFSQCNLKKGGGYSIRCIKDL